MSFGDKLISELNMVARTKPRATMGVSGTAKRLAYVLSPATGASVQTVARLAGVSTRTVRAWQAGGTPSKGSTAKINNVYDRFFEINNRNRVSVPRLRKASAVKQQVGRSKLHVTNSDGNDRYWMRNGWWNRFVDAWVDNNAALLDDYWRTIVDGWGDSDPEPWQPHLIDAVEIV